MIWAWSTRSNRSGEEVIGCRRCLGLLDSGYSPADSRNELSRAHVVVPRPGLGSRGLGLVLKSDLWSTMDHDFRALRFWFLDYMASFECRSHFRKTLGIVRGFQHRNSWTAEELGGDLDHLVTEPRSWSLDGFSPVISDFLEAIRIPLDAE